MGPTVDVMAVVKADAYGHGLVQVARAATEGGAACLGVANVAEGIRLRDADVYGPIVVLGVSLPENASAIVEAGLSQTVSDATTIRALQTEARRRNREVQIHLKLETGMGRVGVYPDEMADLIDAVERSSHIIVEGLSTHVGWGEDCRDEISSQIRRFTAELATLTERFAPPRWTHAANSLVTLADPAGHFNLVRVGLLTYGIQPVDDRAWPSPLDHLVQALSVHARLTQIRMLRAGQTVSYGAIVTVDRDTTAAIVPVGYADGYPRYPGGGGHVLMDEHKCPILGSVCMDQLVIDITGHDASIGQEVCLLGARGSVSITANDLARAAGKIPYEMVTGLGARLPYLYRA